MNAVYRKNLVSADAIRMDDIFTPSIFSGSEAEMAYAQLVASEEGIPTRLEVVWYGEPEWHEIADVLFSGYAKTHGHESMMRDYQSIPIYILGLLEKDTPYALVRFGHEEVI